MPTWSRSDPAYLKFGSDGVTVEMDFKKTYNQALDDSMPVTTTTTGTTTESTTTTTDWFTTTYEDTTTAHPSDCPLGWLYTQHGCFYFDYTTCIFGCSWFEALQICEEKGGHLVEIQNQEKWRILSSELYLLSQLTHTEELKWWTGGHYTSGNGFTWFNSDSHVYFADWALYEPSNFEGSSINLASGSEADFHRWYSQHADERNGHPICEKKMN